MASAIYSSNFFYSNRIRVAKTLIITREISANSKVRGKFANAIHTLERSIIEHSLLVQFRLHFLHSLTVVDKESELITNVTHYKFKNHYKLYTRLIITKQFSNKHHNIKFLSIGAKSLSFYYPIYITIFNNKNSKLLHLKPETVGQLLSLKEKMT